jgi:hypothetical protein
MADLIQVKPLIDPSTPYPATVGDAVGEMQRKGFTSSSNAFRYIQQSLDIIHRALRKGSELVTDIIGAIQRQLYTYSADTGVADAYVVTLSPKPLLVPGSEVVFKAANANTGASTLVVNGGSPIAITKQGATALASGDIAEGQIVTVTYDGTNWQMAVGGTGSTGPQGNPGTAATVEVGTTTTGEPGTNAAVTNSGTSSAAVLDFVIPKGEKGDAGLAGQDGAPGIPGYSPNTIISGGYVAWIDDHRYRVSAAVYIIGGVQYSSVETEVTLTTPDST